MKAGSNLSLADTLPLSSTQRFDSLTGMRALAAIAVAIHHSIAFWPHPDGVGFVGQWGYLGVDFFFVLSGFVMQWTWQRGTTARKFLARRFARIYPLIVVTLVGALLAWWYLQNPLAGYVGPERSIWLNLLVIQSWFFNDPGIRQAWNGVTWSLSCEMFFYVCCPLLLPRLKSLSARRCLMLIAVLYGVECIVQLLTVPHGGEWVQNFFYYFPVARFPEFIMGALACRLLMTGYRIPIRSVWVIFGALVLAPVLLFANLVPVSNQFLSYSSLVVMPGFVVTILVAATRDVRRRSRRGMLATRSMVWLGDVSYAYYMVHALILGLIARWLIDGHRAPTSVWSGLFWIVVFLGASVVVSGVTWRLIERPGQRSILWALRANNQGRARLTGTESASVSPESL